MKFIVIILLSLACVAYGAARKPVLKSPKARGEMQNARMSAIPALPNLPIVTAVVVPSQTPQIFLAWDHVQPMPNDYYEFDVERQEHYGSPWELFARVSAPPVEITEGFYRVGVHHKK